MQHISRYHRINVPCTIYHTIYHIPCHIPHTMYHIPCQIPCTMYHIPCTTYHTIWHVLPCFFFFRPNHARPVQLTPHLVFGAARDTCAVPELSDLVFFCCNSASAPIGPAWSVFCCNRASSPAALRTRYQASPCICRRLSADTTSATLIASPLPYATHFKISPYQRTMYHIPYHIPYTMPYTTYHVPYTMPDTMYHVPYTMHHIP